METVRAPRDGASLAVGALDTTVVEPVADVLDDAVAVLADRLGELHEWGETRATCPAEPLVELAVGTVNGEAGEHATESFLEEIGPVDSSIRALKIDELVALGLGEIPGALQEGPACVPPVSG